MNSPNSSDFTPPQSRSSADRASEMETRIDRALEHKSELQISSAFAAKVAARAVAQPLRRRRYKAQFGPMIALLSAPLAVLALFVLAPHAAPNVKSLSFDTEVIFLTELAFIGWWIARTFNPKMSR